MYLIIGTVSIRTVRIFTVIFAVIVTVRFLRFLILFVLFNFLEPALLASLAIIGRFGVTVAYNSGAQYATELIPTCVRGQGVAAVHVAGYALTFFSSYILYLVYSTVLLKRKLLQVHTFSSI